ncbi:MAG: putative Ig domain-containing protein [Chthoniobacteraceae bacterium]|jgi:hypothetical protein
MKSPLILLTALLLLLAPPAFPQSPSPTPDYTAAIRTPPAPITPRINGPRIYGQRPGHPFLYHLPVTGRRPITITAQGLPVGLTLDPATGDITGAIAQPGVTSVTFTATNTAGKDTATLKIVCGPVICLTPPLGWNSWNCFHSNIDEAKIRGAADAMVSTGLIDHGWTYINMDDRWQGNRDANGNIQPSPAFPNMKALADYIHGKGLKIGLYSSPGPFTCAGAIGSYGHEDQDAATYAAWGMDYFKYDWCSYGSIADQMRAKAHHDLLTPGQAQQLNSLIAKSHLPGAPSLSQSEAIDLEVLSAPYLKMRASLDKVNRDIVFSFCQYGWGDVWKWGAAAGGNLWRTTGDISADWQSVENQGFGQNGLAPYAGPGHWNDPDMLEVGNGNLTPDENYTHITLWCMLSAPLLIGTDMPRMSPFIVSLFSNDEVLAVNQDALGKQGWRAKQDGPAEVWMKPLADGSLALAFFNRGEAPSPVSINWSDLKLKGSQNVRDLWRQKDIGAQPAGYTVNVAPHGAELFKVSPAG